MDIILQILGGLAICAVGGGLVFGGALGNELPVYMSGIIIYVVGVFITILNAVTELAGHAPNITGVVFIGIVTAIISVLSYKKLFGR